MLVVLTCTVTPNIEYRGFHNVYFYRIRSNCQTQFNMDIVSMTTNESSVVPHIWSLKLSQNIQTKPSVA